ncbi:MAG: ATP-binding cassette domain-containing protein, partial [Acidimicrobiales bacterium]
RVPGGGLGAGRDGGRRGPGRLRSAEWHGRGRLRPAELAEAAILVDLTVALEVAGILLPFGGVLQALAIIPLAALAWRRRPRALVLGTLAGALLAFLVGGLGLAVTVGGSGAVGLVIGVGLRRGWGPGRITSLSVLGVALPGAAVSVAGLALLSSFRNLTLAQVRLGWHGVARIVSGLGAHQVASVGNTIVSWSIVHWWASVPAVEVVLVAWITVAALVFAAPVLDRLAQAGLDADGGGVEAGPAAAATVATVPASAAAGSGSESALVGPVPARLDRVTYRYPGSSQDALSEVSLSIPAGRFVVVTGPNGSGKSTLARLLAGRLLPSRGTLERPGRAGLGLVGGTALVAQRPESQVIAAGVADDVVWGLPPGHDTDLAGLLALVGLAGMEARETATLSGGQLQRLAVAAALVRSPSLIVADEATAMLDPEGRADLTALLGRLANEQGITTVLVTHHGDEAARADLVVHLDRGRLAPAGGRLGDRGQPGRAGGRSDRTGQEAPPAPARRVRSTGQGAPPPPAGRVRSTGQGAPPAPARRVRSTGQGAPPVPAGTRQSPTAGRRASAARRGELVTMEGVGHVYAPASPWAHRALSGVDLTVGAGEALLVAGPNGSGKSTLAWILAGLLTPTEGRVAVAPGRLGRPAVGIAFQHSRLQVVRATVGEDVAWGTALDSEGVVRALADVGLGREMAGRKVDTLSGGQLRRVALAGLLARRPRLLVLDEPLAGLDEEGVAVLVETLDRLRIEHGIATVVVSHDLEESGRLARRVVVVDGGRVVEAGPVGRTGARAGGRRP